MFWIVSLYLRYCCHISSLIHFSLCQVHKADVCHHQRVLTQTSPLKMFKLLTCDVTDVNLRCCCFSHYCASLHSSGSLSLLSSSCWNRACWRTWLSGTLKTWPRSICFLHCTVCTAVGNHAGSEISAFLLLSGCFMISAPQASALKALWFLENRHVLPRLQLVQVYVLCTFINGGSKELTGKLSIDTDDFHMGCILVMETKKRFHPFWYIFRPVSRDMLVIYSYPQKPPAPSLVYVLYYPCIDCGEVRNH